MAEVFAEDERANSRTVKSCGPDAPMLASNCRNAAHCDDDGDNKAGHRGEHEISRNAVVQGMPDRIRRACGDYTRMLFICIRGCGCTDAPGIPCALSFEGREFHSARARFASRGCGGVSLRCNDTGALPLPLWERVGVGGIY